MSMTSARKVVGRAVFDVGFRKMFFDNPAEALKGYDLSADEFAALGAIPADMLDDFAHNLDERIAMSLLAFGAEDWDGDRMGGEAMDDETAAGKAGGDPSSISWLPRLANVLGMRGYTGAGGTGERNS